ncbi:MAG: class E sortase [Acidimicrobiales bacterium]
MTRTGRVVTRIGLALFAVGVLAIAFVAYQLWGTALYEEQAQSHLKTELAQQLHHALPTSTAHLDAKSPLAGLPPLAHQTAPAAPDPAVNQPIGLLSIPKIGLLDAIVEGVGEAQLEQGPGHYQGTPLPGQAGNASIAGHRTTYAHPFYNLNELTPGDGIYILTKQGFFRYKVTQSQVVAPTDVAVLDSKANQSTLTLTTCNPRYSAATRLVVTADFDPGPGNAGSRPSSTPTTVAGTKANVSTIPGDSLTGTTNPIWPVVLWSALTVVLAVAVWLVWRRSPRRFRWLVVLVGVPVVLLCLLTSFEHISLALPGSF